MELATRRATTARRRRSRSGRQASVSVMALLAVLLSFALIRGTEAALAEPGNIVSAVHSLKCVDVNRSPYDAKIGVRVNQWNCHGGTNQFFVFEKVVMDERMLYRIRPQHSRRCVGIRDGRTDRGAAVEQQVCEDELQHLWELRNVTGPADPFDLYELRPGHASNMCMSIAGGSTNNGAGMIQWTCNGGTSQKWRLFSHLEDAVSTPSYKPTKGSMWQGPYSMPLVPAAAANLYDGRILTWASYAKMFFALDDRGKTMVSIFDPETLRSTDMVVENTQHDMFCPGISVLEEGKILISGGSSTQAVTIYSPTNDSWAIGPPMHVPRGYHSQAVLKDGSVFTVGGSWSGGLGDKYGEVWNATTNQWINKTGVPAAYGNVSLLTDDHQGIYRSDNHMWLFEGPNGKVFQAGPSFMMHWIDLGGPDDDGNITEAGLRSQDGEGGDRMNGNAVMFDVGKILTVGGAADYTLSDATAEAHVIDINDPDNVTVTRAGDLYLPRTLGNAVVLPSGEVVVVGGQVRAELFQDQGTIYTAEIWSPETGNFTRLANMRVPRNYHSTAILLKDGRVWAGGGGLCGPCLTNHPNFEIFTPPYLQHAIDGSPRIPPFIVSVYPSTSVFPGDFLEVIMDVEDMPHTFALVRLSAATHAVNTDIRRIPLQVLGMAHSTFQLQIPHNPAVACPGTYFLFAMNDLGTPSVAKTISIHPPPPQPDGPDFGSGFGAPAFAGPPAPPPSILLEENARVIGSGQIKSVMHSGKCLDVDKRPGTLRVNANVHQWNCHSGSNQDFTVERVFGDLYRIRPQHSNFCLSVKNGGLGKGVSVVQAPCDDEGHQLWSLFGSGAKRYLRASHTGMCLTIAGSPTRLLQNGANIIQWPCGQVTNQKWMVFGLE